MVAFVYVQPRSASATCSSASDSQNWWETAASPEPRTSRSPRNRSNPGSGQNSPNRPDHTEQIPSSSAGKIQIIINYLYYYL